ncbi:M14 family metallopeptidase [Halobacillus mangrovi]|uniref:M14 family metallopeptidase n=1 Tax=Halobacillus mangrovi TaxID=402384 RepID=UPI003D986389
MKATDNYFTRTYEQSRETFRNLLFTVKEKWPKAELYTKSIGEEPDNSIDVIYAEGVSSNDKVLFFTTGEHGIEGYTGATVTHLFVEEYLEKINPETTGICLVHAINPWGMRNFRRVTENNVDLNRNYVFEPASVPEDINENYANENQIFQPNEKVKDVTKEKTELYEQLSKGMMREGYSGIKKAKSMGQFEFEKGVYYGGSEEEESAQYIKTWQRKLLANYPRVIHMDWHTALGPPNEVTMVVSEHDERDEEEMKEQYGMENIEKFTPKKVKGDSTNYFHKLNKEEYPDTYLFSALFEFGTFGTSRKAELREFTTIILENQLYWEGAEKEEDRQWILEEFQNMFYPDDEEWRESVLKEARLGIESVLTQEGILVTG